MNKEKKQSEDKPNPVAPGLDPDDSYGTAATKKDMEKGNYTTVTRLVYDEYDAGDTARK